MEFFDTLTPKSKQKHLFFYFYALIHLPLWFEAKDQNCSIWKISEKSCDNHLTRQIID